MTGTLPAQLDPATLRIAIDPAPQSARQIKNRQAANARTISTPVTALDEAVQGHLTPLRRCPESPPIIAVRTARATGPASLVIANLG